ncbi:DUF5655 domain-containing protein [Erythrobacter sp. Alg231-14]|uniref:DUF5655 domain-containing protein n=1 Tax=Erythrobacter sp. Alg231-14 TaxID=1922225 RepID=UPI000D55D638
MSTVDKQLATMLANVPEKTGKSMADWMTVIAASGLDKHGKILAMLKGDHGVTHGFANLIAAEALKANAGDQAPTDPVADQYSGAKEALKPIYDAIVAFAQSLGDDVEVAPKKTSVSLRRKKQFTLITPATKSRIDLGLALKGDAAQGRLETYNAMCSHRVRLESVEDFDDEVKAWVKEAYSRSG